MAKKADEFFLRFGFKGKKIDDAADLVAEALDIQFFESSNEFLGRQLMYDGKVADGIIIAPNYFESDDYWMCEDHKECPCIITCAFKSGTKSTENEMNGLYVKTALEKLENFVFIDFEGRAPRTLDPDKALKSRGMDTRYDSIYSENKKLN